jgi:hypothetical protein
MPALAMRLNFSLAIDEHKSKFVALKAAVLPGLKSGRVLVTKKKKKNK